LEFRRVLFRSETGGITNTRHGPDRLAFERFGGNLLARIEVNQRRRLKCHGVNIRVVRAGKFVETLTRLRKLRTVHNHKIDGFQAFEWLPEWSDRNQRAITDPPPGIKNCQLDVSG